MSVSRNVEAGKVSSPYVLLNDLWVQISSFASDCWHEVIYKERTQWYIFKKSHEIKYDGFKAGVSKLGPLSCRVYLQP